MILLVVFASDFLLFILYYLIQKVSLINTIEEIYISLIKLTNF